MLPDDCAQAPSAHAAPAKPRAWLWMIVATVWFGSAATGLWLLWAYENNPGRARTRSRNGRPTAGWRTRPTGRRSSCSRIRSAPARAPASASSPRCWPARAAAPEDLRPLPEAARLRRRLGADRSRGGPPRPCPASPSCATTRARGRAVRRRDLGPDAALRRRAARCCSAAASPARAGTPATTPGGQRSSRCSIARDRARDACDQRLRLPAVRTGPTEPGQ